MFKIGAEFKHELVVKVRVVSGEWCFGVAYGTLAKRLESASGVVKRSDDRNHASAVMEMHVCTCSCSYRSAQCHTSAHATLSLHDTCVHIHMHAVHVFVRYIGDTSSLH